MIGSCIEMQTVAKLNFKLKCLIWSLKRNKIKKNSAGIVVAGYSLDHRGGLIENEWKHYILATVLDLTVDFLINNRQSDPFVELFVLVKANKLLNMQMYLLFFF